MIGLFLWVHLQVFTIFTKGDNFCDFLVASLGVKCLQKGSNVMGMNLLPEEKFSFLRI